MTEHLTKLEKLTQYFKTTAPEQFLLDISGGVAPSKQELQIINELRTQQKLPDEVINVLMDSVLRICDMKLPKRYIEKVASHWVRKKIKTVEEAMNIAKIEYEQYQTWMKSRSSEKPKDSQIEKPNKDLKFELKYIDKLAEQYEMKATIAREIINYSREVNQGLMIYWFMDRVAEYLAKNNPIDEKAARDLIINFHEKYVVPFGR